MSTSSEKLILIISSTRIPDDSIAFVMLDQHDQPTKAKVETLDYGCDYPGSTGIFSIDQRWRLTIDNTINDHRLDTIGKSFDPWPELEKRARFLREKRFSVKKRIFRPSGNTSRQGYFSPDTGKPGRQGPKRLLFCGGK